MTALTRPHEMPPTSMMRGCAGEAATIAEAVEIVSRTPCAVAQGVVEVWPLDQDS